MWFQIFKFELQYRKKRPATYIYFGILFLMAFLAISTDVVQIGGGAGLVKENAPATIAKMMVILSAFMMMITSAIMGVGVLRDFEHKAESMIFSTPISKFDYLFGRFLGSFVVTLFAFSGILLGFMFGEFMPWRDADKLLPFNFGNYFHPFIYFVIPNLFFSGVLFFFTGALSRKMVVVYVQWIFLFVLYQIAAILTGEIDNQNLAAIIDPFGYNTIEITTQYWTVAEQNSMTIPITGNVLINRLLWLSVGIVFAILGYIRFNFNVVQGKSKKRKVKADDGVSNTLIDLPQVTQKLGWSSYWLQIWTQAKFYFKYIVKGIPFIAITLFGMAIIIINSFYIGEVFGTYTYPTTYLMLALINGGFTLFFLIILVFYSGELVWRERDVRIDLIQDSLPIPDFVNLVSKFLGLIMVFIVMLIGLMFFGIVVQTFRGYYEYNIDVYITSLFTETLSVLVLLSLLSFFVQVMVNNKFLGHALMILLFISTLVMDNLGVEHSLFQFASADLGTYSEMNGFGHFVTSFSWFDLYWAAFSIFLFAIAVMFAVRGSEAAMKWRWQVGKLRLTRPLITFGLTAFFVFTLSGCYIYYNTNVLNTYANSEEQEAFQADYERKYIQYQWLPQPKVTDMNMTVELYPSDRDYSAEGTYLLKNFESEPIQEIHLQLEPRKDYTHEYVRFSKGVTVKEHDERFNYIIYTLDEPLQPDDTLTMSFKMVYQTTGFKESENNNEVVFNGTFINNSSFPSIGYNAGLELLSDDDRRDNDLEPKERLLPRNDPRGLASNMITDDSHGINFEIVIGTEPDQTAVAPGYLQRQWVEDGRKYFHYKMDQRMIPFFNVVSARYEVMKDVTTIMDDSVEKEISLEIYYHPGHEYNLESMMKGMKDSFKYFSENFSPYQYRQMRILEFPRYANFAQSFANTVPFSEGIGFMLEIKDEDDVDAAYFVTAHELAHQWWAHQVIPANVRGSQVLTEALAQYSALMVMKHAYPQEHIKEFLREELDRYLGGRRTEQKKEQPLALVENQQYIHYGKGANVMFTFQDFIGEDSVNVALQRLIRDWRYYETNDRYPTTEDLMGYFRAVTPDSLQNMVTDLFEKIVLYENKVDEITYTQLAEDSYEVNLTINMKKLEADSIGLTSEVALQEWIDVGVYGSSSKGKDSLLYLQKHLITDNETEITVTVGAKPTKGGIDPLNKFIDRNPDDNVKSASEKSAS